MDEDDHMGGCLIPESLRGEINDLLEGKRIARYEYEISLPSSAQIRRAGLAEELAKFIGPVPNVDSNVPTLNQWYDVIVELESNGYSIVPDGD